MRTFWVIGANGQLGSEIRELAASQTGKTFVFTDVNELNITDHEAVEHFIAENSIDALINCAAYTAVDKAETEVEKADAINHLAVANLARIAKAKGLAFVHISTDYVFEGTASEPYTETDTPNPQSVYGRTKLDGENAILKINPARTVIIRTSWVYSSYGSNFVKTMLRLGRERKELNVVHDQVGRPTYAGDLAAAVLQLLTHLKNKDVGIYHYANTGECSWYEFANTIFKVAQLPVMTNPIPTTDYPTPAKRPEYSVLDTEKIKRDFGIAIPHWEESLTQCLNHWNKTAV
ncbi:dTDP-4-dehydrorhamnose reductase [Ulvibacterium marinum]|uniref:dTDP-4-dehydrorhamnose reductase n=1 Tax=Ulvibacterium marinum TaxID=2419782 RepID=A0A3B0C6P5_9FLAO|nr:dTDP-4-dehydrorhamnose reductase [Ulvibacterium marinum]RKN79759.1 dTDP-4-dehydrorhamnose reductase [Ulvibacterium marinum]